jgi:hypothetical protein
MMYLSAFMPRANEDINMLIPVIIVALVGVVGLGIYDYVRRRSEISKGITIEATIQNGHAVTSPEPIYLDDTVLFSTSWKSALLYSYDVAGEAYSCYFLLQPNYKTREEALEATREWMDRKIKIRYNPEKPYESAVVQPDGTLIQSRSVSQSPPSSNAFAGSPK